MILIYTKHPQKGIDLLENIIKDLKSKNKKYNFIYRGNGYMSQLQTEKEIWKIVPTNDRARGFSWTKCYIDIDIDKDFLNNIVLKSRDKKMEEWDMPMILK